MMTEKEYSELADDIAHKVRGFVDSHPLTEHLSDVARRNMAYCAGNAALSALTTAELNSATLTVKGASR
jgi:hypothetical protein